MRKLLSFLPLYKPHWRMLLFGGVLTIFTLLASLSLLSVSGWFICASAVAGLSALSAQQFNYFVPAGIVRFLSILRTVSRWGERVVTHDATFRVLSQLRTDFWRKITPLEPEVVQHTRQTDLLNRLVTDIDALDHVYLRLLNPLISSFIVLCLLLVGVYFTHSLFLTCLLGSVWCVLFLGYPYLFYKLGQKPGRHLIHIQTQLRNQLLDYVIHLDTFLLAGVQKKRYKTLYSYEQQLLHEQGNMAHLNGFAQGLLVTCTGLITTSILVFILQKPTWLAGGPFDAMLVFMSMASLEIFIPIAGAFSQLARCEQSATRIENIRTQQTLRTFGQQHIPAKNGHLILKDLCFYYPDQTQPTLRTCHLEIKPGEKVVLLGHTGCGKSTLAQIIMRDLTQNLIGQIQLDSTPLSHYSEAALRASIGFVGQRIDIFSGTLADNLRICVPHAKDSDLHRVLQQVQLSYIALHTWIGDGGRTLSGGEKRRVGIARVLLTSPALVLLDEPTESLDLFTQNKLMQCCLNVFKNCSLLLITHRIEVAQYADRVVILENGSLKEGARLQSKVITPDSEGLLRLTEVLPD